MNIAHEYCDLMDGPVYEMLPPAHDWYKLIADCIPDEEVMFMEIATGAGLPVEKAKNLDRLMVIDMGGAEWSIERKRIYLRMRIDHEVVLASDADKIRETVHSSWQRIGEAIRERNPDASSIHAWASSIGFAYAGTHRIFISADRDEIGILGACYYFAIPKSSEEAR